MCIKNVSLKQQTADDAADAADAATVSWCFSL